MAKQFDCFGGLSVDWLRGYALNASFACLRHGFKLCLILCGLWVTTPGLSLGAPEGCVEGPAGVVTCMGDHSAGIADGTDFSTPPVSILRVYTDAITPASGTSGIRFHNATAASVQIVGGAPDAPLAITTQGDNAAGITALSEGSPTQYEWRPALGIFVTGGPAGGGGPVAVESHGTITTSGAAAHGIHAQNRIGTYSAAALSQFALFQTHEPVDISLVSVNGDGADIGSAVAGDNGGSFVLGSDGSVQFDHGTLGDDLQPGESIVTRLDYQVRISHDASFYPYNTDSQLSDGAVAARITNADGTIVVQPLEIYFDEFAVSSDPDVAAPLWPNLRGYVDRLLGNMGIGGAGENIAVTRNGAITTRGPNAHGIYAETTGGTGGTGSEGGLFDGTAGVGGRGTAGGNVTANANGVITTFGDASAGVVAVSRSGRGGIGGDGGWGGWRHGGTGGEGDHGGSVHVHGSGTIITGAIPEGQSESDAGHYASGIIALSEGGDGGRGGEGHQAMPGGAGGRGGQGGSVAVSGDWAIFTGGDYAHGIWAKSVGGNAGGGGGGGWLGGSGGAGGQATDGGSVTVAFAGGITTRGSDAYGVFGQSVGGFGGMGGAGMGIFYASGGSGSSAGSGGDVQVINEAPGWITTYGDRGHGIYAQSVGGGGGAGGGARGLVGVGGTGNAGGDGGTVEVINDGTIRTYGANARGIYAQSIGGGGGDGGDSGGFVAIGGAGSGASDGDTVAVVNRGMIETTGDRSHAIFAESVGGGGGDGGDSGGIVTIGGKGGGGGDAGEVTVENSGTLSTEGAAASGIFAQSIGGGGGNGGGAVSLGAVAVAVGGDGGDGGDGQRVDVTAGRDSVIDTLGDRSYGILAQSVGGGGGNGGFAVAAGAGSGARIAIGGTGGKGGDGDQVQVLAGGTIRTGRLSESDEVLSGEAAHGIFAQSVGGGGGSGGFAVSGALGGLSFNIGLGGTGGDGGDAETVNVGIAYDPIRASIATVGDRAYGVLAQSVGGGGGDGGFSIAAGVNSTALNLAVGGDGGGGGDGGQVNIYGVGTTVSTQGDDAHGIFAQSVGGGGGNGGFSVAGGVGAGIGLNLGFGGKGGTGGAGDTVHVGSEEVHFAGTISTTGDRSHGIFAQSVGGGGGNGGFSITGSVGSALGLGFSFGGVGGAGSTGGEVTVHNAGNITTRGEQAFGVLAQSVGGGGGNGGLSLAASLTAFGGLNFSMGGTGGDANTGGAVTVGNSGVIETWNTHAHGIFVQSVGGGGGNGGTSGAAMVNFSSLIPIPEPYPTGSANFSVSLGGNAGTGGEGGDVTVANKGAVVTHADQAFGILAQSVGGGGGAGGKSIAATGNLSLPEDPATGAEQPQLEVQIDFALAIGGEGGSGNIGGDVAVANDGRIDTSGVASHGIFAQSVGGGGGQGGDARSMTLGIDPSNSSLFPSAPPPSFSSIQKAVNISVGGSAGSGSDGGDVTVANRADIVTRNADAYAIFAQSIGGGGGNGGGGYHGLEWTALGVPEELVDGWEALMPIESQGDVVVVVGGSAGSSGHGGHVGVLSENGSRIVTLGDGAYGVLAQSVGGGGGTGGVGAAGEAGTVGVGGGGGAAGDGGSVAVRVAGDIDTFGRAAHGILAQSVGGGGGIGGNVDRGIDRFGTNLAFARSGGSGGYGGSVTVENTGDITTRGTAAYGIFAQSVGGGGGIAGGIGEGFGFAGSVGGDGDGGRVEVLHTGNITTYGDHAHGIFAQSAGGADFGGEVSVRVSGDITVHGEGALALLAQSEGAAGKRDIDVIYEGGTITGPSASAVRLADGGDNTFTNYGTVTTFGGIGGMAIAGAAGNDSIANHGRIVGAVDLGEGVNALRNNPDGSFDAGATVRLGTGNTLTNRGTLSPGGLQAYLTTALDGDFEQTTEGVLVMEVDARDNHDTLRLQTGTATLGGALAVLQAVGLYRDGTVYSLLETADGRLNGAFDQLLLPEDRPLLRFNLRQTAGAVEVHTVAPSARTVARNRVESAIAGYIDRIMPEAAGDLETVLVEFQSLTRADFGRAFAGMSPGPYDHYTRMSHNAAWHSQASLEHRMGMRRQYAQAGQQTQGRPVLLAFNGSNMDLARLLASGAVPESQGRNGLWLSGFRQWGDQAAATGFPGFDHRMTGGTIGFDYTAPSRVILGLSITRTATDADLDNNAGTGSIETTAGTLYGSYFSQNGYLEGALSYGRNAYENRRAVTVGEIRRTADSKHDADVYSAYLGGGYSFDLASCSLGPVAALRYVYIEEAPFAESGAGDLNLMLDRRGTQALVASLGLRAAARIDTRAGLLMPELSGSLSYDFGIDDRVITASFEGAPNASFSMDGQDVEGIGAVFGAGVTLLTKYGLSTSLRYTGEMRQDYVSHGIIGQLRLSF